MNIRDAHYKLLTEQERLEPLMSIRYMAGVLQVTPLTVRRLLPRLIKEGLAEEVKTGEAGNQKRYKIRKVAE